MRIPTPHLLPVLPIAVAAMFSMGCVALELPDPAAQRQRELQQAHNAVIHDLDPAQRCKAAALLGRSGYASAIPVLATALEDPAPDVRTAAARALQELGEPARAVSDQVMAALKAERDPEAVVVMAWLMYNWDIDLAPAQAAILPVMKQAHPLWRYHAALLMESVAPMADVVSIYLQTIGTAAAEQSQTKPQERISVLIPFAGSTIWPLLLRAADDSNAVRRAAVATIASKFKPFPPAGADLLAKLLRDPDPTTRAAAAWACLMAEPEPVRNGPLLLSMLEDTDADVRASAARALGQFIALGQAPTGTAEALGQRMADTSAKVREYTAQALGSLRNLPQSVAARIMARLDPAVEVDPRVRGAAAAALGFATPGPELKAALRRGFDDPDLTVRERCIASTGHLGFSDPETLQAVAARTAAPFSKGERLIALGALNDIGPAAQPVRDAVQRAMADPDADIRSGAELADRQIAR